MDTTDAGHDYTDDPDEDVTDVITEAGLTMEFESEEEDGDIDNEEWIPRRNRKALITNRLVNSLASCLDESKFDRHELPEQLQEYKITVEKRRRKTDVGKFITWTNNHIASRPTANVSSATECLIGDARSVNSEEMAWDLFITPDMISNIVHHSNQKIERIIAEISLRLSDNEKLPSHIRVTDCIEVKSFFGLLYARGLLGQNKYAYKRLFMEDFGHPIFGAVMSVNRFGFLHAHLTFDNADTRRQRFQHDRFAAFRDLFEKFNDRACSVLEPGDFLTVDETLYPCRNQIGFRQYNKSKPKRYGLLYKSVNAVRIPFTFRTVVYSGKPEEPGPHYIRGSLPTVKALVSQVQEFVDLSGRVISLDRLYTSIELFEWLQAQDVAAIGTIDCMRKGIPPEIKAVTGREERSYQVYWNKDNWEMTLNSYVVPTKSKGNKNVLLLSTVSPIILGVTKDDGVRKPAIYYKLYDFTKGGTDIIDQRINFYTVHTKSPRWTMNALAYILDTARVNSQTIYAIKTNVDPRKCSSLTYGWNLVKALCNPQIERRQSKACSFRRNTVAKMDFMLGHSRRQAEEAATAVTHDKKRTRCHACLDLAYGSDYRKNRRKVKKSMIQCHICHKHSCGQHLKKICTKCFYDRPNQ